MKRPRLASHQLWSEVNPDVILEFTISGTRPDKNRRGWHLSIDTPNYGYYVKWMEKYSSSSMTYWECEEAVKEFGKL